MDADGTVILAVRIDLDADERDDRQRRCAPRCITPAARSAARHGRVHELPRSPVPDNPRAIHEELVRRDAPLEHLWVVGDHACQVPPTATVVRREP